MRYGPISLPAPRSGVVAMRALLASGTTIPAAPGLVPGPGVGYAAAALQSSQEGGMRQAAQRRRRERTGPAAEPVDAPVPNAAEHVLALQRGAGNAAVAAALGGGGARRIQRMATPNELVAEVGLPPKGGSAFGGEEQKRAAVFEELLAAMDLYRMGTTNVISGFRNVRAEQSKALVSRLDAVVQVAQRYEGDREPRGARVQTLRHEARAEIALIGAINRDPAYDGQANPVWSDRSGAASSI